jgi:hypothetical protein
MEDKHKQADASLASAINIDSSDALSVASAISLVDKVSPSQHLACSILHALPMNLQRAGPLYRRLLLQRALDSPAARTEVQKLQARMSTVTLPTLNEVRRTPHWHLSSVTANGCVCHSPFTRHYFITRHSASHFRDRISPCAVS